jgi:hypothetical protein
VGSGQWGGNTHPFAIVPLRSRAARRLLFITCTYVYMSDAILDVTRAQNQLAKFKSPKISSWAGNSGVFAKELLKNGPRIWRAHSGWHIR